MRIAMLAPITRRVPPRPYGPEEQMISDLVEGLVERGHQVVLFAAGNSLTRAELVAVCPTPLIESKEEPWPEPRWWEELHIAECVQLAARGEFDLIHNHMHAKALPFMGGLSTPVLTTLHGAARDQQLHRILRRFREYPFVAMDDEEKLHLPELNYVAQVPLPKEGEPGSIRPMVDLYEAVYQDLVFGRLATYSSRLKRLTAWGSDEALLTEPACEVRKLRIAPGEKFPLSVPAGRREHWTLVSGRGQVKLADKTIDLEPGQAIDIPPTAAQAIANPGQESAIYILVRTASK